MGQNNKHKPKSLACFLSADIGGKKLDGWPIELIPTYNDGKHIWASGQVIHPETLRPYATINISELPITQWPANGAPPGRPREDEKHFAVLLAWATFVAELGGKFQEADNRTAELFNYSDHSKIRKIRNPLATRLHLKLRNKMINLTGPERCAAFIKEPVFEQEKTSGKWVIYGDGVAWHPNFKEQVFRGSLRIATPNEPEGLLGQGGPIIISVYKPGH